MRIDYKIKPKNIFWKLVPFSDFTAQSIYPNIYFPKSLYNNLVSKNPEPRYLALLEHEKYHIKREEELGLFMFGFKYLFNSKFRLEEEIAAYKIQIKFLRKRKEKLPVEKIARHLSGPMYLWSTSYKNALKKLKLASK